MRRCVFSTGVDNGSCVRGTAPRTGNIHQKVKHAHKLPGTTAAIERSPTHTATFSNCCAEGQSDRIVLGVGVISHQLVRIHINADRRWFRENTHQREIYTSELAKPHVDAGFKKHAADRPKCRICCGR